MLKTVLIDLSGTLHVENQAIPGAVEAIKRLLSTNITVKFVTNTTKESRNTLFRRLTDIGFSICKDDIFSSLAAARSYLERKNFKSLLLLSEDAANDFQGLSCGPNKNPDAVVIGLAPNEFHYERLNEAFRSLQNGAQLIAIHAGKYYKRSDGLALGPGCFVKGLEYSAQCSAHVIGKPSKDFFSEALGQYLPEEAVMIGDDVNDDVEGAQKLGIRGFLVQTGKYKSGDESKISPPPNQTFPSVVEAIDYIIKEISV